MRLEIPCNEQMPLVQQEGEAESGSACRSIHWERTRRNLGECATADWSREFLTNRVDLDRILEL